MNPVDIIVILVVAVIIGLVLWYIHRSKARGVRCIGCPNGAKCSGSCGGCCDADKHPHT